MHKKKSQAYFLNVCKWSFSLAERNSVMQNGTPHWELKQHWTPEPKARALIN